MEPSGKLPLGHNLDWPIWKTLNRLDVKRKHMKMWKWWSKYGLFMQTRTDNVTPTCIPKRTIVMYLKRSDDKQPKVYRRSSILAKRRNNVTSLNVSMCLLMFVILFIHPNLLYIITFLNCWMLNYKFIYIMYSLTRKNKFDLRGFKPKNLYVS